MNLSFTPEEQAFRNEVRAFLRDYLPDDLRQKMLERRHLGKEDLVRWQRILNARGWAHARLAGRLWRSKLDTGATLYFSGGNGSGPRAGAFAVQRQHDRPGALQVRHGRPEAALPDGASRTWTIGGARVFPNPAPDPIWRR